MTDGTVMAWGLNDAGQLGLGYTPVGLPDTANRNIPTTVAALGTSVVQLVGAGRACICLSHHMQQSPSYVRASRCAGPNRVCMGQGPIAWQL